MTDDLIPRMCDALDSLDRHELDDTVSRVKAYRDSGLMNDLGGRGCVFFDNADEQALLMQLHKRRVGK